MRSEAAVSGGTGAQIRRMASCEGREGFRRGRSARVLKPETLHYVTSHTRLMIATLVRVAQLWNKPRL